MMKTLHGLAGIFLLAATAGSWSQSAQAALGGPDGVVIPYAGKLELDGALVTGLVDFEFGVAPAADGPVPTAPVDCRFTLRGIPVTNGEFAVSIVIPTEKESCVKGNDVHLEVRVARAGGTLVLLGKQRVTPVVAAATSGIGDFAVAGALTANTAVVTGALRAGPTTVGTLSAGPTTVTGSLVVTGGGAVLATSATVTGSTTLGATNSTLRVNGTVAAFGVDFNVPVNNNLTAPTDGFVVARLQATGGCSGPADAEGLAGPAAQTLQIRAWTSAHSGCFDVDYGTATSSFTMPVRKGELYAVKFGANSLGILSATFYPLGR